MVEQRTEPGSEMGRFVKILKVSGIEIYSTFNTNLIVISGN